MKNMEYEDKVIRLKKMEKLLDELNLELDKLSKEGLVIKKMILEKLDKQKLLLILNHINNIKD